MSHFDQLLIDTLDAIRAQLTTVATAFRELRDSTVLDSATYVFDANGVIERSYPVPYNAVTIDSDSAAAVTLANQPNAGAAPARGQGVVIVGPYGAGTYNIAGRALTLYGTPGDSVTLIVDARVQPPCASPGQVAIAGTAAVSGSVTALTQTAVDVYTESPTSRLTNGNTATLTWPAHATETWIGVNVTGFAGGTNVQFFLDQQDANGIWQQIANTGQETAAGTYTFGCGPGQAAGAMLRSGGAFRIRWVVTGTFTTLTFQLGVSAR